MASIKPTKSTETGSQLEHRGATDYPETPNVFISPHHNPVSSQTNVHYGIEQDYANAGSGHHRVQMGQESSHQQPPLPPSPATHSHRSNGAAQHPLSQPDRTTAPDTQRVTRAFGLRVIRTVRRGQLPFLLVFFGCVLVFFSALSGIGYVDPDTQSLEAREKEFQVGRPVFVNDMEQLQERVKKMKALEEEWAKQKRPEDGAWLKPARNQREIRKRPLADSRFQRQKQLEESLQEMKEEEAQHLEKEVLGAASAEAAKEDANNAQNGAKLEEKAKGDSPNLGKAQERETSKEGKQ